jgi:hypothetical protein
MTLKYYSHLNLTYDRDLAVQLLKSVQNECRNPMTDEVKTIADKILSWAQILMTELCSMKSHTKRTCRTWRLIWIFFTSLWWIESILHQSHQQIQLSQHQLLQHHLFSRISQLYKQSHFRAAHCSNECELTLKVVSLWLTQIWRKRVKFRPWLQQIVAKLNVNMSDNNVSMQFWYLHSQLKELTLSQVTSWITACIKSNKVLNCTIIEKLINQLWHVYNDSKLREEQLVPEKH